MGKPKTEAGWSILSGAGLAAALGACVVTAVVSLPGCGHGTSAPAKPDDAAARAVIVALTPVKEEDVQRKVMVVGTFEGLEEVTVIPKVQGHVVRICHDVGDVVRPDDVLLELDRVDHELAVDEARKALESELAKIGLTALPPKEFDFEQLPTVVKARNLEENSGRRLRRVQQLRNTLTQEDQETAATDYKVAQATRQQMVFEAQGILATARHKQSLLATAQQRLTDTEVKVPRPTLASSPARQDDGPAHATVPGGQPGQATAGAAGAAPVEYAVAQRMVAEGDMVRAGGMTPVFRLVIDKRLKLHAAVPERYVDEVRLDRPVEIRVEAYPGRVFSGTITRISPTVERVSRTFQIEVQVANQSRELKPGGFANVTIITRKDANVKMVPADAVVTTAGTNRVYVAERGKARSVVVLTGDEQGGWKEIRAVLVTDPHDPARKTTVPFACAAVVTSGQTQLADGVAVVERKPAAAAVPAVAQSPQREDRR
jgi:multidrug efflux pump subunit AcrA (membrane-fusion protein)